MYYKMLKPETLEHPKTRYEEAMMEAENFMKELYEIAKNFAPLYNKKGGKIVYFDVEEKDGQINSIYFNDSRRGSTNGWKSFSGIKFTRSNDWSFFSLTVNKGSHWSRWTTKTGHGPYRYGHYKLSDLLDGVREKVKSVNNGMKMEEEKKETRENLVNLLNNQN